MLRRFLFTIVLLLSVLFAPFWLSAVLGIVGMFAFRIYWEAAVVFLISDLLYGTETERFLDFPFISLTASVLALSLVEVLKRKLRYYE